jgi:hypothetical protein
MTLKIAMVIDILSFIFNRFKVHNKWTQTGHRPPSCRGGGALRNSIPGLHRSYLPFEVPLSKLSPSPTKQEHFNAYANIIIIMFLIDYRIKFIFFTIMFYLSFLLQKRTL